MSEQVNHPQHYGGEDNTYEAIKVIEDWGLNFNLGNTVKYIARKGKKSNNDLEELKKAKWYLQREIDKLEKNKSNEHKPFLKVVVLCSGTTDFNDWLKENKKENEIYYPIHNMNYDKRLLPFDRIEKTNKFISITNII